MEKKLFIGMLEIFVGEYFRSSRLFSLMEGSKL